MTTHWAGVSGKGNRINPSQRPNLKRKGHLSPRSETNFYRLSPFLNPLVSHWSLPLTGCFSEDIHFVRFCGEINIENLKKSPIENTNKKAAYRTAQLFP